MNVYLLHSLESLYCITSLDSLHCISSGATAYRLEDMWMEHNRLQGGRRCDALACAFFRRTCLFCEVEIIVEGMWNIFTV